MNELWTTLRDPRVSTTGALLGVLAAGFLLIGLAYRAAAATALVAFQMPYVISGGVVGIALLGAGLVLLSVHVDRVEAAEERRQLAALQRQTLALLRAASADDPRRER